MTDRRVRRTVVGVATVSAVVATVGACGGTVRPAADARRNVPSAAGAAAEGGDLLGGLGVASGSRLIGGVFVDVARPGSGVPAAAETRKAVLVVDSDPLAVLRDYDGQLRAGGYDVAASCTTYRGLARLATSPLADGPLRPTDGLACDLSAERPVRPDVDGVQDGVVSVSMRMRRGRALGIGSPQSHLSVERRWFAESARPPSYGSAQPTTVPDSRADVTALPAPTALGPPLGPAAFGADGLRSSDVRVPAQPAGTTLAAPVMVEERNTLNAVLVSDRPMADLLADFTAQGDALSQGQVVTGDRDGVAYGTSHAEDGDNLWYVYVRDAGDRRYVLVETGDNS